MKKKAKLEMETLGKILLLTAFLIIFLLLFKGCKDQMENVGVVGLNEYICWLSQAVEADLFFLFPSACYPIDVDEPQDMEGISNLMRKCWWMHGQGEKDILSEEGVVERLAEETVFKWKDVAQTCFLFTPKEDIKIGALEEYLHTHDRAGNELTKKDLKSSTWYYIQREDQEERGICFDKKFQEKEEGKLQKGKRYFIIFYDERTQFGKEAKNRDKIMISRDPNFAEKQTGVLGTLRTWKKMLKGIFTFEFNKWCYSSKEDIYIEDKEENALNFFNEIVETLQRCAEITSDEACICDDSKLKPLSELPEGYSIKLEKLEEKKYNVFLVDKNGKRSPPKTINSRIGYWPESSMGVSVSERGKRPFKCLPDIIKEKKIEKQRADYSVIFNPNNQYRECFIGTEPHNPKEEDFSAIYFSQDIQGFKTCSEKGARLEKAEESEREKEEQELEDALGFFAGIVSVLRRCADITGYKACKCDASVLKPSIELPEGYSIKLEKLEEKKYNVFLVNKEGEKSSPITIEGVRIGYWPEGSMSERGKYPFNCLPDIINEKKIEKHLADYYIAFHPNNDYRQCFMGNKAYNPREKEFSAIYLAQEDKGLKNCVEANTESWMGIFLGKGTTIPYSIVLDKKRVEEENNVYITYLYDCNSANAEKSCADVKKESLIEVELKPTSELEPGFFGRVINYFKTSLYTYQINQDYEKRERSWGKINIIINAGQLKENEEYTLTLKAYDEYEGNKKYRTLLTKSFKFKFSPFESQCTTLLKGEEEKFKLYFIGDRYLAPKKFKEDVRGVIDEDSTGQGLFSIEPFKSHKEKFTVYYNSYSQGEAETLVKECPKSMLLFLSDRPFRSFVRHLGDTFGTLGAGVTYLSTTKKDLKSLQVLGVHEFGHAYASLADEYEEENAGNYPGQPNCASDKEEAEEMWSDLEGVGTGDLKIGFFEGCSYTKTNIRPTLNSVMRYHWEVSSANWEHGYGPVNERCLLKILKEGGTCEEPEDLDKMKKYTSDVKEAYSKT